MFTVEAEEEEVTPTPKAPKARTRLNVQAVKEAVASGSASVVQVAAQVHAPPPRTSPRKKPATAAAGAPKGK